MFWSCIFQQNHQLRCPIAVPRVLVPVQNGKPFRYRWLAGKNDERTAIRKGKQSESRKGEILLLWKNRGIVMESSCDLKLKAENRGEQWWPDWRRVIHGSFMRNSDPFRNFFVDMEVFQTYPPLRKLEQDLLNRPRARAPRAARRPISSFRDQGVCSKGPVQNVCRSPDSPLSKPFVSPPSSKGRSSAFNFSYIGLYRGSKTQLCGDYNKPL